MKTILHTMLCLLVLLPSFALAAEINVSAAASLREAINEIAASFTKKSAGVKITTNFDGSGALAKQIESGAPAYYHYLQSPEAKSILEKYGFAMR